jgi:aldose 1-epimerase
MTLPNIQVPHVFTASVEPWQDANHNSTLLKLADATTGAYATFALGFGAALNHLVLPNGAGQPTPITLAADTPTDFATTGLSNYYGTLLSPFPNRIKDGCYTWEGNDYQLVLNHAAEGHAIHGLVWDKPFVVQSIEANDREAKATLAYQYDGQDRAFPFAYYLELNLRFTAQGLTIQAVVINTGQRTMPFGLGWHPYFSTGNPIDGWEVTLPTTSLYAVDDRMIPTSEHEPYTDFATPTIYSTTHLDTCFSVMANEAGMAVTTIHDPIAGITFEVKQEVGVGKYNFLQVYSPTNRQSLAIEPMTCAPDAFNNGLGLISLGSKESMEVRWGVSV